VSRGARLAKLEAELVTATPENPGAYCRACGGLTIGDAFNALDTLDGDKQGMTAEAATAICEALEAGKAACRRCGDVTLYGALLDGAEEEAPV
jgi:hypothetical protein